MQQVRQQQGFTMIELIMVIVILGVLSAFALPRFADLGGSARQAVLEGVEAAIKSSMGIVRAQALASGVNTAAADQTITMDGATVNITFGYPTATAATNTNIDASGMVLASGLVDDGTADGDSLTEGDIVMARASETTVTITVGTTCRLLYTEAIDDDTPATIATQTFDGTNWNNAALTGC